MKSTETKYGSLLKSGRLTESGRFTQYGSLTGSGRLTKSGRLTGRLKGWWGPLAALLLGVATVSGLSAQNSLPAPGSGGSYRPAPVTGGGGGFNRPGPGMGMGPGMGPSWGGIGWNPGPGWNNSPTIIVTTPNWTNQGTENVVAFGYDVQGVWQSLPLHVAYVWNGVQYTVTVLNAWNPFSQSWNIGVDQPAYNTSYYLRGNTYDFYVPLSTGTYYFNL